MGKETSNDLKVVKQQRELFKLCRVTVSRYLRDEKCFKIIKQTLLAQARDLAFITAPTSAFTELMKTSNLTGDG